MIKQFDNEIASSFMLYVDHLIQQKGNAYYGATGTFFPVSGQYYGKYTYACPFKQLVNDSSLTGSTDILSGVYLNGNFITVGQSGLESINHYQGSVTFNTQLASSASLTGSFSVKDFNVYMTSEPEDSLIYQSKFFKNPRYSQTFGPISTSSLTVPAVFIKKRGGDSVPFSFGAVDESIINFRAIVISDNQFLNDAACSILKDSHMRRFSVITDLPFDKRGSYTGQAYDYTGLADGVTYRPLIKDVDETRITSFKSLEPISSDLHVSFVDFEVSWVRSH